MEMLFGKLPEFFKDEEELRALWSVPETRARLHPLFLLSRFLSMQNKLFDCPVYFHGFFHHYHMARIIYKG